MAFFNLCTRVIDEVDCQDKVGGPGDHIHFIQDCPIVHLCWSDTTDLLSMLYGIHSGVISVIEYCFILTRACSSGNPPTQNDGTQRRGSG